MNHLLRSFIKGLLAVLLFGTSGIAAEPALKGNARIVFIGDSINAPASRLKKSCRGAKANAYPSEPIKDIKLVNGGHHGAVRDLLAAIDEKREPLCGPEAGRETVELTLAVFASFAAGGKKVALPLADRQHPLN